MLRGKFRLRTPRALISSLVITMMIQVILFSYLIDKKSENMIVHTNEEKPLVMMSIVEEHPKSLKTKSHVSMGTD